MTKQQAVDAIDEVIGEAETLLCTCQNEEQNYSIPCDWCRFIDLWVELSDNFAGLIKVEIPSAILRWQSQSGIRSE